jgi:hypothetical protein
VALAFPWGKPGTDLALESGPEPWQRELLAYVRDECIAKAFNGKDPVKPTRCAVSSGHGIGKSALTAWLILWVMATRPKCQITVTAATLPQLQSKTWAALSKWHSMCLFKDWFDYSNSRGNLSLLNRQYPATWFARGLTCEEDKSESFAGQHEAGSSSVYLFDEASAIPDKIWDVAEGGLTDGEPFWFVFSNPTRNTGRFRDCFEGIHSHRWKRWQIDSRDVSRGNKEETKEWEQVYGADSDWFRVRVRGVFPRTGSTQFISSEVVTAAVGRFLPEEEYSYAPKVLGIDIAREGTDQSVICRRQGRMCSKLTKYRLDDLMILAGFIAQEIDEWRPDAVFVDGNTIGAGVVDRLRHLGYEVISVSGQEASGDAKCLNKRSEMWVRMRDWLKAGASIPKDNELESDLTRQEYEPYGLRDKLQLIDKKAMRSLGMSSPDCADALGFTFAHPVFEGRNVVKDFFSQTNEEEDRNFDAIARSMRSGMFKDEFDVLSRIR